MRSNEAMQPDGRFAAAAERQGVRRRTHILAHTSERKQP